MEKDQYAFMCMGPGYEPKRDRALTAGVTLVCVPDLETAAREARALWKEQGVKAIELCGAFGEQGARAVIEATEHQVAVGYVVHFPEQDELFKEVFGD